MPGKVASYPADPADAGEEQIFMSNEMFVAVQLLKENELSLRAFEQIKNASGKLSGWDLARTLQMEPEKACEILALLRSAGVIKSSGEGLEGYYYLSDLGFKIQLMQAA
jgi:hypothetical protein